MGTFRPLEEATGGVALGGDGEAAGGGAVAAVGVALARERTPDGDGTANNYLPNKELMFSMEVVSLRNRNVLLYPPFSPPASHWSGR